MCIENEQRLSYNNTSQEAREFWHFAEMTLKKMDTLELLYDLRSSFLQIQPDSKAQRAQYVFLSLLLVCSRRSE